MWTYKEIPNKDKLTGVDVNIDISLCEYGIAWSYDIKESEGDLRFVYGVEQDNQGNYISFDWGDVHPDRTCYQNITGVILKIYAHLLMRNSTIGLDTR